VGGLYPINLKKILDPDAIAAKVKEVSFQITKDYQGKDLVLVMVLKGALLLVADMMREINLQFEVQSVQCSSYGSLGTKRGDLRVDGADRLIIHNRDVLIVDDIFDSGNTMRSLMEVIKAQAPRSLKTCVLLCKKDVSRTTEYRPDYVLFDVDNLFVVGYGLDYKEHYRGLNGVYVLENV
jgi:hypoxanthine phosphoribosyltransferase